MTGGDQKARKSREELRALLLSAGQDVLHDEGIETGFSNLTFKRVFDRLEKDTGLRITNGSVIGRVWENQAAFQADVLVSIAQDEGRPEVDQTLEAVTEILGNLDRSTGAARLRSVQELSRVGGAASVNAIGKSSNWSLWISVLAYATTAGDPAQRERVREALLGGYNSMTKFWEQNYEGLMNYFGLRICRPWTIRDFTIAVTAYSEGCSLRQRVDGHLPTLIRPTGPDGEDQEWTLFAVGLEALIGQFFEPDPDFELIAN